MAHNLRTVRGGAGNLRAMSSSTEAIERLLEQSGHRRQLPEPWERRDLRERALVSQHALAAALGVEPSTVCRWERGTRQPRPGPTLSAYLEFLTRVAAER